MADPNILYFNVNFTNNSFIPVPASTLDRRDAVILQNPSEWEMSIVRFQISSDLVPLFTPEIPNPVFPLRTDMSITLRYAGTSFQEFVNVSTQEAKNGIFSYNNYLDNLNTASTTAFNALKAAFPGADGTSPPLFYLDPKSELISMYVQDLYLESNANRIEIWLNQPLQQIIGLPYTTANAQPAASGLDYQLSVRNYSNIIPALRDNFPLALSTVAGKVLQVSQEFTQLDEWSNVKSILFTTSLVPCQREFLPNVSGVEQSSTTSNSALAILTDFQVNVDNVEPIGHSFTYLPTAEYRMVSMTSTNPFSAVDVSAQYQTFDGRIFPLFLSHNSNMSLKIMFRRKIKK